MICHHYKCIFVHIPKTAGQSIETVFLNLLDLDWKTRAPLLLRENDIPELGPPRLAHLKATEYVDYKYIPEALFRDYYKFTFVRNPWDRVVSLYKGLGFYKHIPFKVFVMNTLQEELWKSKYWFVGPQNQYICDKQGNFIVDFIGRFESLQEDFNHICTNVGLMPTKLPHVNASKKSMQYSADRPKHSLFSPIKLLKQLRRHHKTYSYPIFSSYIEYYDDESIKKVRELYSKDIEMFGYQFENNKL